MIGIGPFLSHHDTPFAECANGTVEQTLLLLSIFRLMHPPGFNTLHYSLSHTGRQWKERGILAGANVVPNLLRRGRTKKI